MVASVRVGLAVRAIIQNGNRTTSGWTDDRDRKAQTQARKVGEHGPEVPRESWCTPGERWYRPNRVGRNRWGRSANRDLTSNAHPSPAAETSTSGGQLTVDAVHSCTEPGT